MSATKIGSVPNMSATVAARSSASPRTSNVSGFSADAERGDDEHEADVDARDPQRRARGAYVNAEKSTAAAAKRSDE